MNEWKVPLAEVHFGPEEIEAVSAVLRSGWITQGPRVERFEAEFAQFLGVKFAMAVANGTAALHLACLALDLGPGDEVLCPSLTFIATANAIRYCGAQPRFVDICGPQNLNLSPEDVSRKITPRTKAIMVVHYAGFPADMTAIREIADRHGLAIIEDCAHAPGATYFAGSDPHKVGTLGSIGCFSFFSNKNMTTGEGGMVVSNDPSFPESLRRLRSHGMTTLTWDRHRGHSSSYDVVTPGFNYRLDEMRAALGLVQLSRLEINNAKRRNLTRFYRERLGELLQLPFLEELKNSSCHIFPVLLPKPEERSRFMDFLKNRGIQSSIHYPAIHRFSYYQQLWPRGFDHELFQTEEIAAREVTLPLFPSMTMPQLEEVIGAVQDFCRSQ